MLLVVVALAVWVLLIYFTQAAKLTIDRKWKYYHWVTSSVHPLYKFSNYRQPLKKTCNTATAPPLSPPLPPNPVPTRRLVMVVRRRANTWTTFNQLATEETPPSPLQPLSLLPGPPQPPFSPLPPPLRVGEAESQWDRAGWCPVTCLLFTNITPNSSDSCSQGEAVLEMFRPRHGDAIYMSRQLHEWIRHVLVIVTFLK